jgi:hypothetical protein
MSNEALRIRNKLFDYIRVVDTKKLYAMYNLLETEIEQTNEWWNDKVFTIELDRRYNALENGKDKGFTTAQLESSIDKLRIKKYGR